MPERMLRGVMKIIRGGVRTSMCSQGKQSRYICREPGVTALESWRAAWQVKVEVAFRYRVRSRLSRFCLEGATARVLHPLG